MKKTMLRCIIAVGICIAWLGTKAQGTQTVTLSPNLLSQNGWMPDTLGGGSTPTSTVTCKGLNTI